jgi:glycosyltransferase involved in cell wall biosynthesis
MTSSSHFPFFSVVIPTYNRSEIILPTLKSVQNQTYSNFECIVVDDGSDDGEKLRTVVQSLHDSRFSYVRQENGGACRARNHGIDLASGRYIALLDSDDIFLPNKLERVAQALNQGRDIDLVYSQMLVERGLEKKWIRPSRGLLPAERVDEYLLCTPGTIRTSTVVVSTTLAKKIRFDESLPSLQDTDFAIRAAYEGAAVEFIEEPLVVFNDKVSGDRVSRNAKYKPLLAWLKRMRGKELSERAYWAGRGWQCARIASYSNRPYGILLYLQSAVRGVFPFPHALIVAAQIAIPHSAYQKFANVVVRLFGRRAVKATRPTP